MVRLLLDNGADARAVDDGGITALHCASLTDRSDTLAEILDWVVAKDGMLLGSDSKREFLNFSHTIFHPYLSGKASALTLMNAKEPLGSFSPLTMSAYLGSEMTVRTLIQYGCDLEDSTACDYDAVCLLPSMGVMIL